MKNTFVALGLLALQACNTGAKVDSRLDTAPQKKIVEVLQQSKYTFVTASQKTIVFDVQNNIPETVMVPLAESFRAYINEYDRPYPDHDTLLIKGYSKSFDVLDAKAIMSVPEDAHMLKIYLDHANAGNTYDCGLHEWTHLRKNKKVFIKDKIDPTNDNGKIQAVWGFSIYIKPEKEKKERKFSIIEEATAEFLAIRVKSNRSVGDPRYFALGQAMQCMDTLGRIDKKGVKEAFDNSDIRYMANGIYPNIAKKEQIMKLMILFQNIRNIPYTIPNRKELSAKDEADYIKKEINKLLDNKDSLQ